MIREEWYKWIIVFNLILITPRHFYLDDAMSHWLLHLTSLSASGNLFIAFLLIFSLYEDKYLMNLEVFWARTKYILVEHAGLLPFTILCFLYFPTYLADLRFIDKYDWFTVPIKLVFWTIAFGFTLTNIIYQTKNGD